MAEKKCSRCGKPFRVENPKSRAYVCPRCKRNKANASARARRGGGGGRKFTHAIRFGGLGGGGLSGGVDFGAVGGPAVNADFYASQKKEVA